MNQSSTANLGNTVLARPSSPLLTSTNTKCSNLLYSKAVLDYTKKEIPLPAIAFLSSTINKVQSKNNTKSDFGYGKDYKINRNYFDDFGICKREEKKQISNFSDIADNFYNKSKQALHHKHDICKEDVKKISFKSSQSTTALFKAITSDLENDEVKYF